MSDTKTDYLQTITIKELAAILNRSPATISTEISKAPHKLPPRLVLPGSRKVLWLKSDVEDWIREHRTRSTGGD